MIFSKLFDKSPISGKLLDAVTEDVVENKSPTNSIKSSSNSIETDNNAWDTASISCSVLLCNTVDCDTSMYYNL